MPSWLGPADSPTLAEIPIRLARREETHALSELAFLSKAYWGYDEDFMAACRAELTVTPADIARCRPLFTTMAHDAAFTS